MPFLIVLKRGSGWPDPKQMTVLIPNKVGSVHRTDQFLIKPARKPQAFKPGDEWRPERSVGDPAKPGGPKETLDFSPGSFIFVSKGEGWEEEDRRESKRFLGG